MRRYLRLFLVFVRLNLKRDSMIPRIGTVLNIVGRLVSQMTSLAFLWVLFGRIASLGAWSLEGVAFIFAVQSLCIGLTEFFMGDLWGLGVRLMPGRLDTLLASPLSPLFQLVNMGAGTGNIKGPGVAVLGAIIVVIVSPRVGVSWGFLQIVSLVVMLASGGLMYFGFSLAVVSVTFWTKQTLGMFDLGMQIVGFARYPLDIFPRPIQTILTWVVPFAFTGFYPAVFLMTRGTYGPVAYLGPLAGLVCVSLGLFLWRRGLRRYETGV